MREENWKPVEGYENYEVSDFGRVKSSNCILKLRKDKYGYLRISLRKNRMLKTFTVHKLVATAFIPNPDNLSQVNHKNEDKTDNRVENLEWCTPKYNNSYGTRIERLVQSKTNGKTSKPVLQFSKTGDFIQEWPSLNEIKRVLGFAISGIYKCCLGRPHYNSAYNFIWRYK